MVAQGLQQDTLTLHLKEAEATQRQAAEAAEERTAQLKLVVTDGFAAADARRAELQMHLSEVNAKFVTEGAELRRYAEGELQALKAAVAGAAKQADMTERLSGVSSGLASGEARSDRLAWQLATMQEELSAVQLRQPTFAAAADLDKLRDEFHERSSSTVSAKHLEGVTQDASERELKWQARQQHVETACKEAQREVRQMTANLEEISGRLGTHALAVEVEELRGQLGMMAGLADKDSLRALQEQLTQVASRRELHDVRSAVETNSDGIKLISETMAANMGHKADLEALRKAENEIRRIGRAVDERMTIAEARSSLEAKADAATLQTVMVSGQDSASDLEQLRQRLVAMEDTLASAKRNAAEAVNHARSGVQAVNQLQAASDKHWQITRGGREELAQLVKAVRALLMDAELRVAGDEADRPTTESLDEYSRHGWSIAPNALGTGGGGMPTKPLGAGRIRPVSPRSLEPMSKPSRVPRAGTDIGPNQDILQQRRRLLAGAGLAAGNETLSETFALFSKTG